MVEEINSRSKCFSLPWAALRVRHCNQQRHCLLAKPSQEELEERGPRAGRHTVVEGENTEGEN